MLKTYEYRLYPNREQEILLAKHFGATRFIYNWGLAKKVEEYEKNKKCLSFFDLCKELTILKNKEEYMWLYEISNPALQYSLRHLDNAFTRFFREKKGFPKFKSKKNNKQTYSIPEHVSINFDKQRINIPKFQRKNSLKIRIDRIFEGKIKTCTIKKTPTNKYFISILVNLIILFKYSIVIPSI